MALNTVEEDLRGVLTGIVAPQTVGSEYIAASLCFPSSSFFFLPFTD
jgi:hypothetical protein